VVYNFDMITFSKAVLVSLVIFGIGYGYVKSWQMNPVFAGLFTLFVLVPVIVAFFNETR